MPLCQCSDDGQEIEFNYSDSEEELSLEADSSIKHDRNPVEQTPAYTTQQKGGQPRIQLHMQPR